MDEFEPSCENINDFDGRLVAARKGSREVLGGLLDDFRAYLLRVANEELDDKLRPRGGASDLVQEAITKAYCSFDAFRGVSRDEWRGWLRRILLNELANFVRTHKGTAKRSVSREVGIDDLNEVTQLPRALVDKLPSPSEQVIDMEERARAETVLARLPADYRRVIELYHKESKSFPEIAELMGRSIGAVQKLWLRALNRWNDELHSK